MMGSNVLGAGRGRGWRQPVPGASPPARQSHPDCLLLPVACRVRLASRPAGVRTRSEGTWRGWGLRFWVGKLRFGGGKVGRVGSGWAPYHLPNVVDWPEAVGSHRHRLHEEFAVALGARRCQRAARAVARRHAGRRAAGAAPLPPCDVCGDRESGMPGAGHAACGMHAPAAKTSDVQGTHRFPCPGCQPVPTPHPLAAPRDARLGPMPPPSPHRWGRCRPGWARSAPTCGAAPPAPRRG